MMIKQWYQKSNTLWAILLENSIKIIEFSYVHGLAHATGVHEHNTVPYARFALKKRHGFCAKARKKNM